VLVRPAQVLVSALAEHNGLLDAEELILEDLASARGVLGVTRYEWAPSLAAPASSSIRGPSAASSVRPGGSFGREHRRCVHRGQIHLHGRKGRRVLVATQTLYQGLVRDSQAQYEALVVAAVRFWLRWPR